MPRSDGGNLVSYLDVSKEMIGDSSIVAVCPAPASGDLKRNVAMPPDATAKPPTAATFRIFSRHNCRGFLVGRILRASEHKMLASPEKVETNQAQYHLKGTHADLF